jgi:hypothetical protein
LLFDESAKQALSVQELEVFILVKNRGDSEVMQLKKKN